MLLTAWPSSSDDGTSIGATIRVYEIALDGIRPKYVDRAVKAFVQGCVHDHNPEFRPKPPRLAEYARSLQSRDERINEISARVEGQKLLTNDWRPSMSEERRKAHVETIWQAARRKVLEDMRDADERNRAPRTITYQNDPQRWRNRDELAASMDRIMAFMEDKGTPLAESEAELAGDYRTTRAGRDDDMTPIGEYDAA